jgi:hypothetical protein
MAKTIPQLTDATTVNAADELIIQQGGITKRATGAELAKGLNEINGTVNVRDFGAVGDGVADDTAAFAAMVSHLNTNGGRGYLPAGNYLVDAGTIVLTRSGCSLVGAGRGNNANLQASSSFTAAPTTITVKGAGSGMRIQGQGVTIEEIRVTSDAARTALSFDIASPGIRIEPDDTAAARADRAEINNVRVDRQPGDGVLQVGACTYSIYNAVDVYECKGFGFRLDDGSRTGIVRTNKHYPGLNTLNACRVGFCGGHALAASNPSVTTQFGMAIRVKLYDFDSFGNGSDSAITYAAGDGNVYDVWIFGENCIIEKSAVSGLQGVALTPEQLGGICISGRDNEINNCRFINTKQPIYWRFKTEQPSSGLDVRKFRLFNNSLTINEVVVVEDIGCVGLRVYFDRKNETAGESFTLPYTNRLGGVAVSAMAIYQDTVDHLITTVSSAKEFTIADDGVKKITLFPASASLVASGVLIISPSAASGGGGILHCRVGSAAPATHKWTGDATTVVGPSTGNGVLTGTTGSDGDFTVSCDSTGIYLENRRGFLTTINVALVGFTQFASVHSVS